MLINSEEFIGHMTCVLAIFLPSGLGGVGTLPGYFTVEAETLSLHISGGGRADNFFCKLFGMILFYYRQRRSI